MWSALVLVPTLSTYARINVTQRNGSANIRSGQFEQMLPRDRWLSFSLASVCERRFPLVTNLNLPGMIVGAPLTVPAVSFLRQHPLALSAQTWHTVTIPFFCLPAWWFVGRGLDGLITRRSLHWPMLAIGSILSCGCIALVIGILTSPPADKQDLIGFLPGGIFWATAFAVLPLNWLVRRHPVEIRLDNAQPR